MHRLRYQMRACSTMGKIMGFLEILNRDKRRSHLTNGAVINDKKQYHEPNLHFIHWKSK